MAYDIECLLITKTRLDLLRTTLLAAAEQFERYVDYHLAKTPADRDKAATNLEWAAKCREAAK